MVVGRSVIVAAASARALIPLILYAGTLKQQPVVVETDFEGLPDPDDQSSS